MEDSYSQAEMHYIAVQPHPYLHSLHVCILQLHFKKCIQNLIIGCKLATTEYGAKSFFQSQLVSFWNNYYFSKYMYSHAWIDTLLCTLMPHQPYITTYQMSHSL